MMGIYGVVAFLVGRRHREMGVRIALGASRRAIFHLIIRQSMAPVAGGTLVGIVASAVAMKLIASQLYGVSSSDPLTFGTILVLLFATAWLACWLPARRAAGIDPAVALRAD